ncbi:MAG: hypothetical protein A2381_19460 [Bdellovibrionales bacterium RIFOXYB1_FULL_37_110]|nr:MAG: hypothetical protein A2417_10960 [Bdellovibrionales bacterium RIFOXYC1_FULL_37_79]OFZ60658.1 MAG: hypothetical protein A2381_19460 [Bdellovibrionales bacterium RIFOXYB1_FULL_37_110]OFZ64410.1 MAG: hypothetical protein A2577_10110 [Bdellovibrionales bacterium RIFOXYD1_FULL_36_51]
MSSIRLISYKNINYKIGKEVKINFSILKDRGMKKFIPIYFMWLSINSYSFTITHDEGTSCYDEDQIFKRCVDQRELYQEAMKKAVHSKKELLIIYGYDNCGWSRSMHNLLFLSSKAERFNEKFLIRTIAKSSGNLTGQELIESLIDKGGFADKPSYPFLIIIDPESGNPKKFIKTGDNTERNFDSWDWNGQDLQKVENLLLDLPN